MKRRLLFFTLVMVLVLCLIAMMSSVAFATDEAGGELPPDINYIDWTQLIIAGVGLVFTGVIIPIIKAGFVWLKSKTENEAILTAITEAQAVADNVVARLQANIVDGLKSASKDGKLSASDAENVMESAIKMFCMDISDGALNVIKNNADDAAEYIQSLIEARLAKLKNTQPLALTRVIDSSISSG